MTLCLLETDLNGSNNDECAILYAGINQTGESSNIPVGEFEHNSPDTNYNGLVVMHLGDDSESVYVYPVRAQVFAFWAALTFFCL